MLCMLGMSGKSGMLGILCVFSMFCIFGMLDMSDTLGIFRFSDEFYTHSLKAASFVIGQFELS